MKFFIDCRLQTVYRKSKFLGIPFGKPKFISNVISYAVISENEKYFWCDLNTKNQTQSFKEWIESFETDSIEFVFPNQLKYQTLRFLIGLNEIKDASFTFLDIPFTMVPPSLSSGTILKGANNVKHNYFKRALEKENEYLLIKESFTKVAHASWVSLMNYLKSKGTENEDNSFTLKDSIYLKWMERANTKFKDLDPRLLNSHQVEAEKYLVALKILTDFEISQ